MLSLSMIRSDNTVASWVAALFIVADCGADITTRYRILQLGGIVDYDTIHQTMNILRTCIPYLGYHEPISRSLIVPLVEHAKLPILHPPESNFTKYFSVSKHASTLFVLLGVVTCNLKAT
jgi:hypothetical protein